MKGAKWDDPKFSRDEGCVVFAAFDTGWLCDSPNIVQGHERGNALDVNPIISL